MAKGYSDGLGQVRSPHEGLGGWQTALVAPGCGESDHPMRGWEPAPMRLRMALSIRVRSPHEGLGEERATGRVWWWRRSDHPMRGWETGEIWSFAADGAVSDHPMRGWEKLVECPHGVSARGSDHPMRGWEPSDEKTLKRVSRVRSPHEGLGGIKTEPRKTSETKSDHPMRGWEPRGGRKIRPNPPGQITP